MSYSAVDAYSDICAEIDKGPSNGDFDGEDETEANTRVVQAFYARQAAARAMLAALETLANWCEHEDASAKQCAPVIHARAAIAAAKAAGIETEPAT